MLRGTWYYNKEIKVEIGVENAKIITNVQTFRDWTSSVESTNIPLMKGTVPKRLDICYDFGTFNTILNFYFLIDVFSKLQYDPHSYGRDFCNCIEKPEKVRTSTGFESVASQFWCDALTNLTMKPLRLGAGHVWVVIFQ